LGCKLQDTVAFTCTPHTQKHTTLTTKIHQIKIATTIHDLRYNGILPELMDKKCDFRVEEAGATALMTVAEPGTVLTEHFLLWVSPET
jgi:hypothetical protein